MRQPVTKLREATRRAEVGQFSIGVDKSRRAQLPPNIGRTWSDKENAQLIDAFQAGHAAADIAERHGRTVRAIEARLEKLGLMTAGQRVTSDRFGAPVTSGVSKDGIKVPLVEMPKPDTA